MTTWQKAIQYAATALAILLIACIVGGAIQTVGAVVSWFDREDAVGEMQSYSLEEDITSLDLEIGAAELIIENGEHWALESNLKALRVEEKDTKLSIVEESHRFSSSNGARITLTIPHGTIFDRVDIETGAGRVTVEALQADTLRLTLGAGEVTIQSLSAEKSASIQGGAGKVVIEGGSLSDLDMEMGVGALSLTSRLLGSCEIEHGVGRAELTLLGSAEAYTIKLDKGLGKATLDGQTMEDGGTYGNGETVVDIDGGVGDIVVAFQETNS